MDWYALLKFLHVAAVVVWIGGGFAMVVLGVFAEQRRNHEAFGRIVENVAFLSMRLFMPASLAALVFGAIAAYISWGVPFWIWIGLFGYASTFLTGSMLLGPLSGHARQMIASEGYSERVAALGAELLGVAKFDYVMLFVVVADMVFKPTVGDWPLLAVFVVILVATGAYFLPPAFRARGRAPSGARA